MKVGGTAYRSIWLADDGWRVQVIDQTKLPFAFEVTTLASVAEAAHAIRAMVVRGAPLIGATAAYGLALALRDDPSNGGLATAHAQLLATRPTAVNLAWALEEVRARVMGLPERRRAEVAYAAAAQICDDDVACNRAIGEHGFALFAALWEAKRARDPRAERLEVLTHCNAGWLATVDWGTALAPIYLAHDAGLPIHVWVDETRPRNQGASLTAWELGQHGVAHAVIADNAGGHLMQHGMVDAVIVGTDRTTATGDVCNKIGTYLKALAAKESGVPFFVAAPSPSIDWKLRDGVREIPIEERSAREQTHLCGRTADGAVVEVQLVPDGSVARNFAFDVTPAKLVTAIITERGVAAANAQALAALFPERAGASGAVEAEGEAGPGSASGSGSGSESETGSEAGSGSASASESGSRSESASRSASASASASELSARAALIHCCRALRATGLTFGTSGNVSLRRDAESFFISPTGADYDELSPDDVPLVHLDGRWWGGKKPSSEWRFHRDILRARPEVNAIVHTHSTYATALACRGEGIPPFHYMVAVAGGPDIRCAPYFTYGTQALAEAALVALQGRRACLLSNHGVIALGPDLTSALRLAGEVENLARQYLTAQLGGTPRLLDAEEIREAVEKFSRYGAQATSAEGGPEQGDEDGQGLRHAPI